MVLAAVTRHVLALRCRRGHLDETGVLNGIEDHVVTVPMEYRRASADFEAFLAEAADAAGLATRNQAYTMAVSYTHLTLPTKRIV